MRTEETRAVVGELYEAYARHDLDRVASLLHDDIDWIIYGPVQVFPFEGARRGKPAVLEALGGIAKDYTLNLYAPQVMIVDGDRAAVMSDVGVVQRATGRTLRFRVADITRFADGKLIEFREFTDSFDLVEQALGKFIEV